MSEGKKIKVDVYLTERVIYQQTITMSVDEFKRLDALAEDDEESVAEELLDWIDRMDVCDSRDPELVDFRPAEGEPDPRDEDAE